MIFLSDGECSLEDEVIQDVCRSAVGRGWVTFDLSASVSLIFRFRKPLSFHAVSFGNVRYSYRLERMAQLALEIQNNAPRDPLLPAESIIPSSFTTALDTVST
jgi:hypothetical protein